MCLYGQASRHDRSFKRLKCLVLCNTMPAIHHRMQSDLCQIVIPSQINPRCSSYVTSIYIIPNFYATSFYGAV